jgi:hypothetical protein
VIPCKTTPRKPRGSWFGPGTSTPSTSVRALLRGSSHFKEREQRRGYLDLAVLEYMKDPGVKGRIPVWPEGRFCCTLLFGLTEHHPESEE